MKIKPGIVALFLIIIAAGGLAFLAWNARPQLLEIYPKAGEDNVPATSGIRLEFSGKMQAQSVVDRLQIKPATAGILTWDGANLIFTPDQAWSAGNVITVTLDAGSRASSWLSLPMGSQSWSFRIGEEMLAYLWPADGPSDIYALTPSTGKITRYTRDMGVLDFSASSDGLSIYFSASNAHGGADIYRLDRTQIPSSTGDTYHPQMVLGCEEAQCRNPVISVDNKYLAYEAIQPDQAGASGPARIWVLDLVAEQPTGIGLIDHETLQPAWSSTGLLAYYDATARGYEITDHAGAERRFLPNQTGQPGEWNPAGDIYLAPEVSYYQAPENTERGISHLLSYDASTGAYEDLSSAMVVEDIEGVFSPDGGLIAFARKFLDATRWTLGRQLWIMTADGSNAHPITDEADYIHYDIAWSHNGTRLAYVRFDESRAFNPPELWMINVDGSDPIQLVIGGYGPLWIP
jgi:Tol biopolymer transport system component